MRVVVGFAAIVSGGLVALVVLERYLGLPEHIAFPYSIFVAALAGYAPLNYYMQTPFKEFAGWWFAGASIVAAVELIVWRWLGID